MVLSWRLGFVKVPEFRRKREGLDSWIGSERAVRGKQADCREKAKAAKNADASGRPEGNQPEEHLHQNEKRATIVPVRPCRKGALLVELALPGVK